MSVRAELTVPQDVITPGDSLTAHLRVWNESRIVDAYRLRLIGPPADWPDTEVELGQLPVYPGNHEKINIPIALPRDSELAPGSLTFAVQVASVEDPGAVAVPEADISVGEFHDIAVEPVRPRVGGALWSSNLIVLENTGNAITTVRLRVAPEAEDAPLRLRLRRTRLTLRAGERARVSLMARVTNPVFVGTAATWRIGVRVEQKHAEERTASFVHRQHPILPKPVLKALIALTAVVIALVALWISPVGGEKPKAETETAKGPSQVAEVKKAEKREADKKEKEEKKKKDDEDKAQKEREEAGALKKKPFQTSLAADTKKNKPVAEYTVEKGYRLVVKTVQMSASGPENGTVFLSAGTQQLQSTSVNNVKDYTPSARLSLKEDQKLTLRLDCPAPPPAGPAPTPSASGPPAPSVTSCTATAVVTGDLIPLKGPNAEPDTPGSSS
jgi:cytoskeletal protein RodZ